MDSVKNWGRKNNWPEYSDFFSKKSRNNERCRNFDWIMWDRIILFESLSEYFLNRIIEKSHTQMPEFFRIVRDEESIIGKLCLGIEQVHVYEKGARFFCAAASG